MENNISNNYDSEKNIQLRTNMESLVKNTQESLKNIVNKKENSKKSTAQSSELNYASAVLQDTKIRNLLQKVARGDNLTKEEEQMIKDDAELEQKVDKLKRKKKDLENKLKSANSEQRKQILNSMILEMSSKDEYNDEDLANMQLIQQFMHKYKDDMNLDSKDKTSEKNEKFIASNIHYDYYVD